MTPTSATDSTADESTSESEGSDVIAHRVMYASTVVAVGLLLLTFLFTGTPLSASLKLIFLAILILTLRRWTAALLLALMQIHQFVTEPSQPDGLNIYVNFVWVILSLLLVMTISRYRTLCEIDGRPMGRRLLSLLNPVGSAAHASRDQFAKDFSSGFAQLTISLTMLTVSAMVAWLVISLVPQGQTIAGLNTVSTYRLRPGGYRVLMLGLLLFAGYLLTWLMINEAFWRRISRAQAGVFLRSTVVGWLHSDLRMVVTKRLKIRRKKLRPTKPDPEFPDEPDPAKEQFMHVSRRHLDSSHTEHW